MRGLGFLHPHSTIKTQTKYLLTERAKEKLEFKWRDQDLDGAKTRNIVQWFGAVT